MELIFSKAIIILSYALLVFKVGLEFTLEVGADVPVEAFVVNCVLVSSLILMAAKKELL